MEKKASDTNPSLMTWYQRPYTRNLCVLVMVLAAIFLSYMILPLLSSIFAFLYRVLLPFFLSLIIYYALRPIVKRLQKKLGIHFSISLVFVFFVGFIVFVLFYAYPQFVNEIILLKKIDFKIVVDNVFNSFDILLKKFHLNVSYQEEATGFVSFFVSKVNELFTNNLLSFMSMLTTALFDIFMIPFILFFLLKDDKSIYSGFVNKIPFSYRCRIDNFLTDVDNVLVHFISGRIIVSACVSALLFIAFLAVGIKQSYFLAAVAFVFFIIPSVGWLLASILPLLVGFSMGISMGVEVLAIMFVAAGLEGLWLTPEILGMSLMIHPLTIIFLLLGAGYLFGIVGLIFITPAYALLKVFAVHLYKELMPKQI